MTTSCRSSACRGREGAGPPPRAESALFGTKIADDFFSLNIGGDVAYLTGVLRHLIEHNWADEEFVAAHTEGFGELHDAVLDSDWDELALAAGATRGEMLRLAHLIGNSKRGILVWSMGVTQHAGGEEGVRADCRWTRTTRAASRSCGASTCLPNRA